MKQPHTLEVLNNIAPDLVEEANRPIPPKRRLPKAARVGLAAACLCLALAGTAFAANPGAVAQLLDRLTVQIFSTGQDTGYTVDGAPMVKYPLSAFSPALLAASEGRESAVVMLSFSSWDEVQAFIGAGIPLARPASEGDKDRRFTVYLFHTEYEVLWGVDVAVAHTTDLVHSAIEVQIRTEHWPGDDARAGMGGGDGTFTHLESYPMANGAQAEIVQYTGPEDFPHANCEGYFMKNGILYCVTAFATVSTAEDAAARLHAILDSFP